MYDVPMHSRWAIPMLIAASMLAAAAQSGDDADAALRRTRERLLADLERLPRYTCVQTVTRRYYRPRSDSASCSTLMTAHERQKDKLSLGWWDRLRLEVAIVDGENVFSWVGAPRFERGTLEQLSGRGPLGSGDFGPFLHSILGRASVTFSGKMPDNQGLLAYSYNVPVADSRYMVWTDSGWTPTAYGGVFVIDPEAEDIVSLTVRTAELPEGNPDCQAISEVDYGRTEIHDRRILIPRETRLTAIARNGSEIHNVTEYESCREYSARSRIVLEGLAGSNAAPPGPPGAAPAVATTHSTAPAAPTTPFPAGLHFHARIVTLIDSDTAAAGDPLELVLRSPIRDKNHAVLAPAGARLHARLVGMEQRGGFFFRVSLQFESIELKGLAVPMRARADNSNPIGMSVFMSAVSVSSQAPTEDVTVMTFFRQHLHIEKFDWSWTTLAVPAGQAVVSAP